VSGDIDWARTLFVLVAPDGVARHASLPVLRRLRAAGFMPRRYLMTRVRPEQADRLHEVNIRERWQQLYRYRAADQLFAFGPCLVLLLEDERPQPSEPSHLRMRRLKGDSQPGRAGPGTIRGDLGMVNALLAVIHSSDSAADAEREGRVFFGDAASLDGLLGRPCDDLEAFCHTWNAGHRREDRCHAEVLSQFRFRLAAALWPELGPAGRALLRGLEDAGAAAAAAPGVGAELAGHLAPGTPAAYRALLAADFRPGAPVADVREHRHLLAAQSVELDPWEELVLTTSCLFPVSEPSGGAY
jgi:nucleoside diphosphate kinase